MGKITEIVSEDVSRLPPPQRASVDDYDGSDDGLDGGEQATGENATLTSAEREQILFETGVLEKLGLPADYITLEEAQRELDGLRRPKPSSSTSAAGPSSSRPQPRKREDAVPEWTADSDSDSDDEDDYGLPSDLDEGDDDNADRLMRSQEARSMSPSVESALDLVIWTMPFGFLYTLLDVLVRQQYGETVGLFDELGRLAGSVPLLALFIWYNLTSRRQVLLQFLLFAIFTVCTPTLIWIVNKSPYDVVLRRVPPLGTLCIFAAVRLDLLPTCIGLAAVAAWVKVYDMKIIFD